MGRENSHYLFTGTQGEYNSFMPCDSFTIKLNKP